MTIASTSERLFFGMGALACGAATAGVARLTSVVEIWLGNEIQKHHNECPEKQWFITARICVLVAGSAITALALAATGYMGIFALTGTFIPLSPTLINLVKITVFSVTGFCTLAGTLIVCVKPRPHEPGACPLPPGTRRTGVHGLHSSSQPPNQTPAPPPKPAKSRMPGPGHVLGTGQQVG